MPDGGDVLNTLTDVGGSAAAGAGLGAAGAAISGGDVGKGALIGGATGGVAGGISDVVGGPGTVFGQNFGSGGADVPTGTAVSTGTGAPVADLAASSGGAGVSAAGVAPPAGAGGGMADLTQLDSSGSFASPAGAPGDVGAAPITAASGDAASVPFGSDQVPTQALAGKPDASSGGTFSDILGKVKANPGAVVSGAGLLTNLIRGNQPPAGSTNLTNQANQFSAQGQQLSSYINTGTLPPGAQAGIDQAVKSMQAGIRAKYAANGIPPNSTMEQQELNNVTLQAQAQAFQIANQLLSQGISESGLASGIYENLIKVNEQQNADTGNAIANFAAALGGSGRSGKAITGRDINISY